MRVSAGPARLAALVAALWLALLAGCAAPGRAELEAYLARSEGAARATDAVLDLVAPYERIVLRNQTQDCAAAPADDATGDGAPPETAPPEPTLRDPPLDFAHCRRDAFATIGDPPVVGAARALSGTLGRLNGVMAARASGVSHQLLRRDFDAITAHVGSLAPLVAHAEGAATALAKAAADAAPLGAILAIGDDAALRAFVTTNRAAIVAAYAALSASSDTLWGNVRTGARQIGDEAMGAEAASLAERAALVRAAAARADQIAVLIADWTVVVDAQRGLFERYADAIARPGGLDGQIASLSRGEADADAWAQGLVERTRLLGVRPPRIGDRP